LLIRVFSSGFSVIVGSRLQHRHAGQLLVRHKNDLSSLLGTVPSH